MTKNSWGVILLAIWLIIEATLQLTNVRIVAISIIHAIIAAGAGICLLLGK